MTNLKKANLYKKIWQAFDIFVDVKTVEVIGNERIYSQLVGLRVVISSDRMTSDWYKMPYNVLEKYKKKQLIKLMV